MKNPFTSLILICLVLVAIVFQFTLTSSNVVKARPNQYEWPVDTLDEDSTGTFTVTPEIKNKTGYVFQVTSTEVSGTVDALAIVRESCWDTENRWVPVDTVAITAEGSVRIEGVTRARRIQLYLLADTTAQSVQHYVAGQLTEEF